MVHLVVHVTPFELPHVQQPLRAWPRSLQQEVPHPLHGPNILPACKAARHQLAG